jgi:hypothetical protein
MLTLSTASSVCAGELLSVTRNVISAGSEAAEGVPEMTPVEAFRLSPLGSVPLVTDHEYAVVPPVAASGALYAWPTEPSLSEVVVLCNCVVGGLEGQLPP